MKAILKKLSLSFLFFLSITGVNALPGVEYSIEDLSGQFIYYHDKSFERESYIGMVYYDNSTYGVRYIAPATGKKKDFKPAKSINILFTLDPTKNHVELTGERITTAVTPDDTDLINYIHDFLYEMTARRQKAGKITESKSVNQIYEQFGGEVTLEFDPLVPITNLRAIKTGNKTSLELVTAGHLITSEDTSFTDFEGIPDIKNDKSSGLKIKKAKQQNYTVENNSKKISVSLDEQWTQQAENFWLLGSSAVLVINSFPETDSNTFNELKRRFLIGIDHSYPDWRKLSISEDGNELKIDQVIYNSTNSSFTNDSKIIRKTDSIMFTLTVYSKALNQNKPYFNKLVKSFEIN